MTIDFMLNGKSCSLSCPPDKPILGVLRDDLGMMASKEACAIGRCGACLIMVDGKTSNACLTMAFQLEGTTVVTTEGLDNDPLASTIRKALADENAFQCGYCAPGFVMALTALLKENPAPDDDVIRASLEGNICRCTGYHSIIRGAIAAARMLQEATK